MSQLWFVLIFTFMLFSALGRSALSAAAKSAPPQDTPTVAEALAATLDQPFTLRIGEWVRLSASPDEFAVQIAGLVSDDRCPANVTCAVRGQAVFTVQISRNDIPADSAFTIGEYPADEQNKIRYAGYLVEMVAVAPPAPKQTKTLKLDEYDVTLVIHADQTQSTPAPTAAPTPISSDEDELSAMLDQPFELRIGQTAIVEEVDFYLTFRSASDNSGCITADDCSSMIFDGTLATRRGEESELLTLMTFMGPGQQFNYEFAGLVMQMTRSQQLSDGGHLATFVVTQPVPEVADDRPAPEPLERCPYFSRFDATAILQEDLHPSAFGNLRFGPQPPDAPTTPGLCGYISAAPAANPPGVPALATRLDADHAMVAGLLQGEAINELLPLVEVLRPADPQLDEDTLLLLETYLAAGSLADVISLLFEATIQSQSIHTEPITDIANEGLWLWQTFDGGRLAILLLRQGDAFAVVAALTGTQVDELTTLDYATIIARRMVEPLTDSPAEPQHQEEPTLPESPVSCDLLAANAAAILGEEVHEQAVFDPETGCGYIPRSEPSPADQYFTLSDANRGVILQPLAGEDLTSTLEDMAEAVLEKVAQPNPTAQTLFTLALHAGNVKQAIQLLPKLTTGATLWKVERVADLGEAAAFLWGRNDDRRVAGLIMVNAAGEATLLVASLGDNAQQAAVRDAMVTALATLE